ncbi:MAG: transglutaminase domain-containing protein [Candidatus Dormibacteraeota bacterium]|nr:transglutaminase domain-containing protein [Candidatus Dormibacteraeota bacterium]
MQRVAPQPATAVSIPRPVVSTLLCAGLMAATSWAVLAAGFAQNAGGAVVVAVAAAVEAGLLARAGVPRWLPLVLGPILALAAIVPTTLGAMPFDGNATVGHGINRYISAIFNGLGSNADWPFTVGLCAVLWLCGYWVGWMAMRERRGVLAVLPVYAILATNVLNTRFVNNVALPEAVAVCFTLLVIADAHLDRLHARWSRSNVAALPGTRSRFAASVTVMSVLLTLLALVLPPVSTADISSHFFPGGGGTKGSAGSTAFSSSEAGSIQFNGSTQPGGALISEPHPVLVYTTDSPATVYLRVVDDPVFIGGNWYPDRNSALTQEWGGIQYNAGSLPRDVSAGDGGVAARATKTVHSVIVLHAGATGDSELSPIAGEPLAINQDGIAYGLVVPGTDRLLTVDSVTLDAGIENGTTVDTTGTISTASVAQLRSAGTNYPGWVRRYVAWSDDSTHGASAVAQLARQWTQGLANPYDMATAIEARFRNATQFTYTLSPPAPPVNEWPIVYFLTTSHRGYCQYFAASMGLMLRTLGIPTRLVNGYGPGVSQALNGRPGQRQQLVTTSDAHTWVEAYFPSYGWIPFEPTPPSADGNYQPFVRGTGAATGSTPGGAAPTPDLVKPGFNDTIAPLGSLPNGSQARGVSPLLVLGYMAGALLVLAVLFTLWLALPRSLRGAWRRLEVVGRLCGMRRRPSETYREYSLRLARAQPRAGAPLAELSLQLGRAQYSRDRVDRATVRRALASWRRVLRVVPLLAWTQRRRAMQPA